MAARDPQHPDQRSAEYVERLRGVDLTGGRSTPGPSLSPDEATTLTTGNASKVKAILGATASPPGTSLLAAYERWRASQAASVPLAKAADEKLDTEARALAKSRKRLRKHLLEGVSPARAAVLAHARYRETGGRSGLEAWSKKIAQGA